MDAKQLAQLYVDALAEIGVAAKIDEEMDVVFKSPGMGSFFISLDAERDPEFMRLVFPNFYSDKDAPKVLNAVNTVNLQTKAVKLLMRGREAAGEVDVSASVECFLAGRDQQPELNLIKAIMDRCLAVIGAGVRSFSKEISQDNP